MEKKSLENLFIDFWSRLMDGLRDRDRGLSFHLPESPFFSCLRKYTIGSIEANIFCFLAGSRLSNTRRGSAAFFPGLQRENYPTGRFRCNPRADLRPFNAHLDQIHAHHAHFGCRNYRASIVRVMCINYIWRILVLSAWIGCIELSLDTI